MNTFICGFSGAGKTYLLKQVQESHPEAFTSFIDLDDYIWKNFTDGSLILGDFIRKESIEVFRELEARAIAEIQKNEDGALVSLGGGSLTRKTLTLLEAWTGHWLDIPFEVCLERIKEDHNRPLAALPKDELESLYLQRLKDYERFQRFESLEQFATKG